GHFYGAGELLLSPFGEGGYGGRDIFVAQYDARGTRQWLRNAGSSGFDSARSLTLDAAGNIYLCGSFHGDDSDLAAHFGSLTLTNSGAARYDNFIAKLESTAVPLHVARLGDGVRLSWSPLAAGFVLQENANLRETNGWTE